MKDEVKKVVKEQATKYAMHYSQDFFSVVYDKKISFQDHYKELKFTKGFFEDILYIHLMHYLRTKQDEISKENNNFKLTEEKTKEFEQNLVKMIAKLYKQHFSAYYLMRLEEERSELLEELQWAKEDEIYHENRDYIKDKYFIGEVSEEERKECILEAQKKQNEIDDKIQLLKEVEKELKRS